MEVKMDYAWGTHIPVLRAILAYFSSELDVVVESGIGMHSTPLLNDVEKYIGIENDAEWYSKMINKIEQGKLIHFPVKFRAGDSVNRVDKKELKRIENWYKELKIPEGKLKLLFVDGFSASRVPCIQALKDKFDLIVYHDAQLSSDHWYGYSKVKWLAGKKAFLTSPKAWTGLYIKEGLEINWDVFSEILHYYIFVYKIENPDCTFMQLIFD